MRGKLQGFDLCLEFFVHGMEFLRVIRRQCGKGVWRNWGLKGENGWFNGVDGSRQLGSCKAESLTDSSYDDDVCPSFSLGGLASWRNDENAHGEEIMKVVEDKSRLEFENANVEDNMSLCVDETRGEEDVIVPEVGMKFNDENEVYDFYKRYAYEVGFPVRKRNSKKDDNGVLQSITLTCSRERRRNSSTSGSLKPQATIQTGCKAKISAAFDYHGFCVIRKVDLDHNHKMSPSKLRLYRCNREISAHVKRKIEVNDMAGIPLHKSFNSAVVKVGGFENLTCVEKDCRNYIEKVRRLKLREGDAATIQSYFSKMQAQCSRFYFSIDLDEELRLKNVFWVNNRFPQAYKEFGDVVTFDTTYLTNKYDMSFAPFVGVNHHGQSTLLGCGLLSNENTDTFTVEEFEGGWKTMIEEYELQDNEWLSGIYDNRG
ncbi:protein FAR1-RELATED SEQUENCE 5-like [Olea europaea var. sylvestris]|uniref:protein FAR1-RELATED SEQUENCE 5-like n=1 Tax=Olea europaea var. sylvestris TaxID=158386 RepID=UPI000C1CE31C|nr:protein FAR1-RELATED SEQUENCE 5-like [Olea europaea var. sylvestris]